MFVQSNAVYVSIRVRPSLMASRSLCFPPRLNDLKWLVFKVVRSVILTYTSLLSYGVLERGMELRRCVSRANGNKTRKVLHVAFLFYNR
jgi:hypothetical protein